MSAFETYRAGSYPYRFAGTLAVGVIAGGVPNDPQVAKAWLKKKLGVDNDALLQEMVAETMVEMGVDAEAAVEEANKKMSLNGFKRDANGLYIEGRQLKAALKEAASVAMAVGKIEQYKWGRTNKQLLGFLAEHVFVVEDRLYLKAQEPTGINQRFVHTFRGSAITYEEYVEDASIDFTIQSDWDFSDDDWAAIWTTGEQQGIGASRSQGFGRYEVITWNKLHGTVKKGR